jgi:RNA polymerase sigma factor (sigma-70 family)
MTRPHGVPVLREIRQLIGGGPLTGLPDGQLLDRFVAGREEAAFEAILRRYGRLVLGVCRRVLADPHSAEDAFQATFLVLVRKAASLDRHKPLGNWLYVVAYRLALRARANAARRRAEEARAALSRPEATVPTGAGDDLLVAVDEELHRLPERHRAPLVLCYLEGRTNDQAAEALGCPRGSMAWRLARARDLLRERLVRRGLLFPAAGLVAALAGASASAAVPAPLLHATARAAVWFASGAASPAPVSAAAVTLAKGALRAMQSKVKIAAGFLLAAGLLVSGAALLVKAAPRPAEPPAKEAPADAPKQPVADGTPLPGGAVARLGSDTFRHGDAVFFAAYTADGKRLLTAGKDDTLRLWDPATGKELRRFDRPTGKGGLLDAVKDGSVEGMPKEMAAGLLAEADRFFHAAVSGDGALVAANRGGTVFVWDAATGKLLHELNASVIDVAGLTFAADGKTLAAALPNNSVSVYDVATGKSVRTLGKKGLAGLFPITTGGDTVLSPDLAYLAWQSVDVGAQEFGLRVMDLAKGKELPAIKTGVGGPSALTFSPDGGLLAWGDLEGNVTVWDVAANKETATLKAGKQADAVRALAFAPDGKTVAVARVDRVVELWDVAAAKMVRQVGEAEAGTAAPVMVLFSALGGPDTALAFTPDGKTLAVGRGGARVQQYDVATGKEVGSRPAGHPGRVAVLGVTTDGKGAVTFSRGDAVRVWDLGTGKELRTVGVSAGGLCAALSADGKVLAVGHRKGVGLYDAETGKLAREVETGANGVIALALSPDGKVVATRGSGGPAVKLWDAGTGQELRSAVVGEPPAGGTGVVVTQAAGLLTPDLAFSPDGRHLAGVGARGQLCLWDAGTGEATWEATLPAGRTAERFAFSGSGRALALLNGDGTVTVYETATGEKRAQLGEPAKDGTGVLAVNVAGLVFAFNSPDPAACLAWSPDGRYVASASGAAAVRLWDVVTGKEAGRLKGHEGPVVSLSFTPDGGRLVSGSVDTTALTWDVAKAVKRPAPPDGTIDGKALWDDLAGQDAARAFDGLRRLSAAPREAAALVRERVKPATPPAAGTVARLVAALGDEKFEARQQAAAELERLGELAEPELRKALDAEGSLDVRQRLERLLQKLNGQAPATLVRDLRAVELLELAGGPESRQVLDGLAKGAPGARLTREAKAALERMTRRAETAP